MGLTALLNPTDLLDAIAAIGKCALQQSAGAWIENRSLEVEAVERQLGVAKERPMSGEPTDGRERFKGSVPCRSECHVCVL
jgi:hypothetical protein